LQSPEKEITDNQSRDEIKHDVKAEIKNLQQTIYLLTTKNNELANKLSAERECNEKSTIQSQQIIDELYARKSKLIVEKLKVDNKLAYLKEQLETLRSRMPEMNLNEEHIIQKYEKQIDASTAKNIELSSDVTEKTRELEMLKESKSLLYKHDCMYKDKLTDLMNKYEYLTTENNELSTDLIKKKSMKTMD